jgi:MinD superfamily P-loop ATPase
LEIIGEIPDDPRVAEIYSGGRLAVREEKEYRKRFTEIAERLLKTDPGPPAGGEPEPDHEHRVPSPSRGTTRTKPDGLREITVISGKGGTGKTSLTACFRVLNSGGVAVDCDVDAANLYLVSRVDIRERGWFSGMDRARINPDRCTGCGVCREACRFAAVEIDETAEGSVCRVDETACEGCGVCQLVCPESAVEMEPAVSGEWIVSDTPLGPLSHARLDPGGENSGKLVTRVRQKGMERVVSTNPVDRLLMDGAPGTGCPVIASLVGCDLAVAVTEPTVSGIHDLERVLEVTDHFSIPAGVIINKADLNPGQTRRIEKLAADRGVCLLGKIHYDTRFTRAQVAGQSLLEFAGRSGSARQIRKIWEQIQLIINKVKGDQS